MSNEDIKSWDIDPDDLPDVWPDVLYTFVRRVEPEWVLKPSLPE